MQSPSAATTRAAETIVAATRALLTPGTPRILIALDGPSGSGKSTLAAVIAEALDAAVVPADDFFAAEITDAGWDARTPLDTRGSPRARLRASLRRGTNGGMRPRASTSRTSGRRRRST